MLNSGTGQFGYVDINTGKFEEITFCPGFARGLSIQGQICADWPVHAA